MRIDFGAVNITKRTKILMAQALEKGFIGTVKYVREFEQELEKWLGAKHVIATANGTMADAISLAAVRRLDIKKGEGLRNEVIVPALTFIAHINAIRYNHLTPVFVDIEYDYQIDVSKIEEKITQNTLAIMPAHLLGKPSAMKEIIELAKHHNLFVIEDACEAFGTKYFRKKAGTIGDIGCFSFYVSHSITTGEGGAAVTDDEEMAEILRSLRNHGSKSGRSHEKFVFPLIGFSAKMNAMEAIIGLGMMEELDTYILQRHNNMIRLSSLLKIGGLKEQAHEWIVPHAYPILVDSQTQRDRLLKELPARYGIDARQIFSSIPTQCEAYAYLRERPGTYPVAEDIGERGLYIPCHQNLSKDDLAYMAHTMRTILSE
ncbi:DegT/DnrJ/EryC1/StrS family aminotransferase [Patescibacteria group bacterium AH-259-L05]|nr:DegT/DnrJ/EryC1/StrS family aminotransferase [Patescibacteria group bacterium AH-259-L05]